MPAMAQEEIYEKVKTAVVDALQVDDSEVTADAFLVADLGAESLDLLDITFRLEKAFGVKFPQEELIPTKLVNNPEFVTERKLNASGLDAMRQQLPYVDLSEFSKNPEIDRLMEVFTVGSIVQFVQNKLNHAG